MTRTNSKYFNSNFKFTHCFVVSQSNALTHLLTCSARSLAGLKTGTLEYKFDRQCGCLFQRGPLVLNATGEQIWQTILYFCLWFMSQVTWVDHTISKRNAESYMLCRYFGYRGDYKFFSSVIPRQLHPSNGWPCSVFFNLMWTSHVLLQTCRRFCLCIDGSFTFVRSWLPSLVLKSHAFQHPWGCGWQSEYAVFIHIPRFSLAMNFELVLDFGLVSSCSHFYLVSTNLIVDPPRIGVWF